MKFTLSLAALATGAFQIVAGQTVYFAGDSTMARNGANDGVTDGWGNYIGKYLKVAAVNKAIGGRSARSYTNEGRFNEIVNLVKPGDIVVIEFGHNDGGSPNKNDNMRSDCPGSGKEVCISDKTGEKVYTFVFYYTQAAKALVAKGATVVLSSQTPNNQWETGTFQPGAPRFVGYVPIAAKGVNHPSVTYVDHFAAVTKMYQKLGKNKVNSLYPKDHTHTSPEAADLIAKAFVQAIDEEMNGRTSLKSHIKTPVSKVY
ncbi:putative rhamnogalacturonan acetylesterase precursor [Fusarium austroafricanum]|uniref:Putative rhamnogalacturonan acetylesterase n=1 Tax=Fusarium austroafricanum TaxID=2364996 RepID=A0A8H4PBL9_9HYPO|nr:putative rhamnogalacturonan acetylesterase precursor [Fusarium austroafricanum]